MDAMHWVPNDKKKLRACIHCYLIKTEKQFDDYGCENGCFSGN